MPTSVIWSKQISKKKFNVVIFGGEVIERSKLPICKQLPSKLSILTKSVKFVELD